MTINFACPEARTGYPGPRLSALVLRTVVGAEVHDPLASRRRTISMTRGEIREILDEMV